MGIYESIYDCEDGNYCVDVGSTYGPEINWLHICDKHSLKIGSKLKYNLSNFLIKHAKNCNIITQKIYDVEVIDIKMNPVKGGELKIVRLRTTFDCLLLKENTKIFYSIFNDAPSWIQDGDSCILTLVDTNNFPRKCYTGNEIYWNWNLHTLITKTRKLQVRKVPILSIDYCINNLKEIDHNQILINIDSEIEYIDIVENIKEKQNDFDFENIFEKYKCDNIEIKLPNLPNLNEIIDKIYIEYKNENENVVFLKTDIVINNIVKKIEMEYYITDYKGIFRKYNI